MELFVGKLVSVVALLSLAEAGFSPERAFSANVASVSVQSGCKKHNNNQNFPFPSIYRRFKNYIESEMSLKY